MNPQWSDEVKEKYIKDQAFYAECTARGIQICTDVNTQKWVVRNKPWVGLTDEEMQDCLNGLPTQTIDVYARRIEAKLKEKNNA
jgi:hypothetical protein